MKKIEFVDIAETETHLAVLTARREPNTTEIIELLDARFEEFDEAMPELRAIPDADGRILRYRPMLRTLYESKSEAALKVINAVRTIKTDRCPYCGRPGKPNTIDHFLPQAKFGEFSLYFKNLVPSCWDCNHTKATDIWDPKTGTRIYLNPYCDEFLCDKFVNLKVVPDPVKGYEVPLFEFEFGGNGMSASDIETCKSHFEQLGINELLGEQFASMLRKLRRQYGGGFARAQEEPASLRHSLIEELQSRHDASTAEHGPNSWESIFYASVGEDRALIDFILS